MSHLDHCRATLLAALRHYRPTFTRDAANELLLEELSYWLACDAAGCEAHWREHSEKKLDGDPKGAPLDPQRGILLMGDPGRGKSLFLSALGMAKRHIEGDAKGYRTVAAAQLARGFELSGYQALTGYERGDLHISDLGTEQDVRHKGYPPTVNTIAKLIEARWIPWEQAVTTGKQDLTFIDTNHDAAWMNERYKIDGITRFTSRLKAMVRATVLYGQDWRPHVPAITHRRPPAPEVKPTPTLSGPELSRRVAIVIAELKANKTPFAPLGSKLRTTLDVPAEHKPVKSGKLALFREKIRGMSTADLNSIRANAINELEYAAAPFVSMIDEELAAASADQEALEATPLQASGAGSNAVDHTNTSTPTPTTNGTQPESSDRDDQEKQASKAAVHLQH